MGSVCPRICGEAIEPPTKCARISVIGLQIMNVFQLIILISAFVTGDSTNGIISVIFVLILFCAWRFLQYRIVVMYILYCMFLFVMSLVWLLTVAQNQKPLFTQGMESAKAAFQLIYCIYYFTISIICFFIYRQFKAISFEKNPAILQYFNQRNISMNDNTEQNNVRIGDDNNFAPNYGQMQPRARQNNRVRDNRQVNQVFAGTGVVIGGS